MQTDRDRCLTEFAKYYPQHTPNIVESGDGPGGMDFTPEALQRLYESYCKDSVGRLYDAMASVDVLQAMRSQAPSILDVTCFATTQLFRIMFPNARIAACDKHLKWLPFLEGVEGRRCNLECDMLPFAADEFDAVIFTETLEHIPRSPYTILGEIRRVLKPGGTLLFSVPNLCAIRNRIKLLLGQDILSVERFHADSFGHFREYTMREVLHLCRSVGLDVRQQEHVYYRGRDGSLFEALSYPLTMLVPTLRPVCQVVATRGEPR